MKSKWWCWWQYDDNVKDVNGCWLKHYTPYHWEPEFMTIFITWQSWMTLTTFAIAYSASAEYSSTFTCVSICASVTGETSHLFTFITCVRPCKPHIFWELVTATIHWPIGDHLVTTWCLQILLSRILAIYLHCYHFHFVNCLFLLKQWEEHNSHTISQLKAYKFQ